MRINGSGVLIATADIATPFSIGDRAPKLPQTCRRFNVSSSRPDLSPGRACLLRFCGTQRSSAKECGYRSTTLRGFGGLGVEDEKKVPYQGFNDGTVYPRKRGPNYIYEGMILRFMKSDWQYQDATNVIGYYGKPVVEAAVIPDELKGFDKSFFYGVGCGNPVLMPRGCIRGSVRGGDLGVRCGLIPRSRDEALAASVSGASG